MKYDLALVADYGANTKLAKEIEAVQAVRTSTEELNGLLEDLSGDLSNEALIDKVATINSAVMRLYNNFKAIVFKGGKRSELRYFYESNTSTVKRVEGKVLENYKDVMVDYPTGMKGTYLDAVKPIGAGYSAMDVLTQVNEGRKSADTILSSMSKGSESHEAVVALSDKVLSDMLDKQNKAMKALRKVFTDKKTGKSMKKVTTVIKGMDDLKACRVTLLELEEKLLDSVEIENRLNKMYESVQLAIDFMKNSIESKNPDMYTPSEEFIKAYSQYIGNLGEAVSNYGEVHIAHMATEHNLALVYTKLMEA